MAATIDSDRPVVRHPFRGGFAGLLLGVGVALLGVSFSLFALGTLVPILVIVAMVVIGVLVGTLVPARGRNAG